MKTNNTSKSNDTVNTPFRTKESKIDAFISEFAQPSIFSSKQQDPDYFLTSAQTYYQEIEEGVIEFLAQHHEPSAIEVEDLIESIASGKTSLKLGSDTEELLETLRKLAKTKTGYYVITKAIDENTNILIEKGDEDPYCEIQDHPIFEFLRFIFLLTLSPFLFPYWNAKNPEIPNEHYFNSKNPHYKIILNNRTYDRISIDPSGNIKNNPVGQEVIFLHELSHTFNKYRLEDSFSHLTFLDQMDNIEEMKAMMFENTYAAEQSSDLRAISHWGTGKWRKIITKFNFDNLQHAPVEQEMTRINSLVTPLSK